MVYLNISFLAAKQSTFINHDSNKKSRNYSKEILTSISTYLSTFVIHLYMKKQKQTRNINWRWVAV